MLFQSSYQFQNSIIEPNSKKSHDHPMIMAFFIKTEMKPFVEQITLWFGMIMVLIVTAGAFAFTFTDLLEDRLYGTKRTFFITVLFAYAAYRSYRLYSVMKKKKVE